MSDGATNIVNAGDAARTALPTPLFYQKSYPLENK
jgi:hypothetical protein